MKKSPLIILTALSVLLSGCNAGSSSSTTDVTPATTESTAVTTELTTESTSETTAATEEEDHITPISMDVEYIKRPNMLASHYKPAKALALPASPLKLRPNSDFSNVYFGENGGYLSTSEKKLLKENGFVLYDSAFTEFYELYEDNRYWNTPNYVTVDSLMHTYHLYFSTLLKTIEKNHFAEKIRDISVKMMKTAEQHCEKFKNTEWEKAAQTELAFFAVGARLSDPNVTVPESVSETVQKETAAIMKAYDTDRSHVLGVPTDYSQFTTRGYYNSDETLKKYFRTMMWYGTMGFQRRSDLLSRTAMLIITGMKDGPLKDWMEIYDVTSFFAGASDDFGYCELMPVAEKVYGKDYTLDSLIGDTEKWTYFRSACMGLRPPAISSVPTAPGASKEEHDEEQIGFRFMGQRFSIDAACFTKLCYPEVDAVSPDEARLLPDALDFPAALGSDTALDILKQSGATDYPNYDKQMNSLRETIQKAPESAWNASLYSAWIYTLNPLLEKKDQSYPYFMQTDAWRRKSLLTFEGSYTELKHDTILYSKQFMGEFGDPEIPDNDDRGYVETEPLVFARLKALVEATSAGLQDYGMIGKREIKNLAALAELAGKLQTIAEKELKGILPSKQEFDLIRSYGGQLEHFFDEISEIDLNKNQSGEEDDAPAQNGCEVIADIAASDSAGYLEVATGSPMAIKVLVEIDGKLHCVHGAVYSFYQFINDSRLTDEQWRERLSNYTYSNSFPRPEWYNGLICRWDEDE